MSTIRKLLAVMAAGALCLALVGTVAASSKGAGGANVVVAGGDEGCDENQQSINGEPIDCCDENPQGVEGSQGDCNEPCGAHGESVQGLATICPSEAPPSEEPSEAPPSEEPTFSGNEGGLTEPPTDAFGQTGTPAQADNAWLLVVALGLLLASIVVLTPAKAARRR